MHSALEEQSERRVVVDHTSSHGPTATHMRGTMLVGSVDNLRQLGCYERYLDLVPGPHRDAVQYAIAASWVPMDVALAHYDACDNLELDDSQRRRLGEMMAERVAATFLGSVLRTTRAMGVQGFWPALRTNDRIYDRMYQGGGVRVIQTGPKDVVFENHGLPIVQSRHWRMAYSSYLTAIVGMFCKSAYVKQVHASIPHPHTIAFSGSWV